MVTVNYLMRIVNLLLHAHFIKPRLDVQYRNTHLRTMSSLLRYLDFITAADEKPASHNTMLQMV